jgi:hypothetical protein
MPSKGKVLEDLKEKGYSYAEVKHIIGTITSIEKDSPSKFKVGDVFLSHVGVKRRPVCVIKVTDCLIYGIPMSTTEDCLNLSTFKSRFFDNGFFGNQLVSASVEYVEENFSGVLDSPKDVRNAIKKLKELVNTL